MNGHDSHLTPDFLDYCHAEKIKLLCLLAHSTHLLQPLDVAVFSPLQTYYSQFVDHNSQNGAGIIDKVLFLKGYAQIQPKAYTEANIWSGFKATELVPFNSDAVLQKLSSPPAPEEDIHSTTPPHRGLSGIPMTPWTVPQITSHMDTILWHIEASPKTEKRLRQLSKVATYSHSHNVLLKTQNKTLLKASQQRKKRSRKVLTTEGRLLTKDIALGLRAEEDCKEAEKTQKKRHREIRAEYKGVLLEKAKAKERKTVERSKLLILPIVTVPEDEISTDSESTDSEASEKL